jgi:hypothetical protein
MIKFFRNLPRRQAGIRQNLLSEGKTGRYLKYAVGESADKKVITLYKLIGKRNVKCLEIQH